MRVFTRKSSVGLAWTPDGKCWGVHLRRVRDRCAVALFWTGEAGKNEPVAERLAEGFRGLAAQENTAVVVGGAGCSYGFADVDMPRLAPDDLRNALLFQVTKFAPVSADRLVWGYRVLPGRSGDHQIARLIYMREPEWRRWIDDASGLRQGVDMIIPPGAVLDPLAAEHPVFLHDPVSDDGFVVTPSAAGRRQIRRCDTADEDAFGARPSPLSLPFLDPGGLQAMPPEEQQGFVPAILLAMYGLTKSCAHDRSTWMPVPIELRPRRHRYSRLVATAMVLYLLGVAGLTAFREFQAAGTHYSRLLRECDKIEDRTGQMMENVDKTDLLQILPRELDEARFGRPSIDRPSMPAALLELTRIIEEPAWSHQFDWTEGTADILLATDDEDLLLIQQLESSPFLGDVRSGQIVRRNNEVTWRIHLNARFDNDTDRAALGRFSLVPEEPEEPVVPAALPDQPHPDPMTVPGTVEVQP